MSSSRARLRWRCRRGLKELDVFFEAFVARGLADVPDHALPVLERLLTMQDQDILAALLGDEALIAERLGADGVDMARRIRACREEEASQ